MNITPTFTIVQNTESFDGLHGEVLIKNNDYCTLINAISWPRNGIVLNNSQLLVSPTPNENSMIPISINYKCEFMIFKKSGNQMVYAIIE
jgi:hypothetical protein